MTSVVIHRHHISGFDSRNLLKTGDRSSTQLAKMSIDPTFVTADLVLEKYLKNTTRHIIIDNTATLHDIGKRMNFNKRSRYRSDYLKLV